MIINDILILFVSRQTITCQHGLYIYIYIYYQSTSLSKFNISRLLLKDEIVVWGGRVTFSTSFHFFSRFLHLWMADSTNFFFPCNVSHPHSRPRASRPCQPRGLSTTLSFEEKQLEKY